MKRYIMEFDGYAYNILDTSVHDGENCIVDGSVNKMEATKKLNLLNTPVSKPLSAMLLIILFQVVPVCVGLLCAWHAGFLWFIMAIIMWQFTWLFGSVLSLGVVVHMLSNL